MQDQCHKSEHGNVQLETRKRFEARCLFVVFKFETENITYGTVKSKKNILILKFYFESENQKHGCFSASEPKVSVSNVSF